MSGGIKKIVDANGTAYEGLAIHLIVDGEAFILTASNAAALKRLGERYGWLDFMDMTKCRRVRIIKAEGPTS